MPERKTIERAKEDEREGKSPSTQAGEFVREEIHHIREGKHGARNTRQAIAIGLSKARRAGVKLGQPKSPNSSESTRRKAEQDTERAKHPRKTSRKRSLASESALKREGKSAVSKKALSKQAHSAAMRRGKKQRVSAAKKAARTRKARAK